MIDAGQPVISVAMKSSETVMRPANFDAFHLSTPLDAPPASPMLRKAEGAAMGFSTAFLAGIERERFLRRRQTKVDNHTTDR